MHQFVAVVVVVVVEWGGGRGHRGLFGYGLNIIFKFFFIYFSYLLSGIKWFYMIKKIIMIYYKFMQEKHTNIWLFFLTRPYGSTAHVHNCFACNMFLLCMLHA